MAVGDFNGDGLVDLAVADYGDDFGNGQGMSVLLGQGDGTFQPAIHYAAGSGPKSVAVGDFNGDGLLDLAVANGGSVSVFLGSSDGSFQPAQNFAAGLGPESVAVGDFNGDGILDLAVAGLSGTRVLLGNGDGSFQTTYGSYVTGASTSVACGDFNGDGLPDLAVTDGPGNRVSILLNDGIWTGPAPQHGGRAAPRPAARGRPPAALAGVALALAPGQDARRTTLLPDGNVPRTPPPPPPREAPAEPTAPGSAAVSRQPAVARSHHARDAFFRDPAFAFDFLDPAAAVGD